MVETEEMESELLRNPAGYKSGFWTSFVVDDKVVITESTEEMDVFSIKSIDKKEGSVKVHLGYTSSDEGSLGLDFEVELMTFEKPFMLMRHSTINKSSSRLEDLVVYHFMDFDVGGPKSYKDDIGEYDSNNHMMHLWDENPLHVTLSSSTEPDGWEISPPTKLNIEESNRDLKKNSILGPRDVAVALQWNLGRLEIDEKRTVEALVTAAKTKDEAIARISEAWDWVNQNLR
ncbi:MAG: hypothetical protein GF309_11035 [Candidatus Lokiarchaeota archaeon]|nr:hypothetical protein [Candidatus Lokiarchaeota archaeon]